ncbi:MAG: hypothetical protein HYY52_05255 [Candidatus Melainabacteria bacterium]|nr:hypothetical protein [Candidatus Melainabacteria bacterium]
MSVEKPSNFNNIEIGKPSPVKQSKSPGEIKPAPIVPDTDQFQSQGIKNLKAAVASWPISPKAQELLLSLVLNEHKTGPDEVAKA